MNQRNVVMAAEQRHDFLRFVRAHQSGVDENTGELIADRFVDEQRCNRRIHAAR